MNVILLLSTLHVLLINHIGTMVPMANNEVMSLAEVQEPRTRSPNVDPGHLEVHITAFGETRSLKLVPREDVIFSADFQGFASDVDENGNNVINRIVTSRTAHEDINSKLYTDSTGSASLYVERRNGHITLEGVLDHETRIDVENDRQGRSLDEPAKHVVYQRVISEEGKACQVIVPNVTMNGRKLLKNSNATFPEVVNPEVLLVLDYETSKFHNFNIISIMRYVGIFFYSVNRRYAQVTAPKLYHIVTGIIYTKVETGQPYVLPGSWSIVDGQGTLDGFSRWMYRNREFLRVKHDLAMWITGLDLGSWDSGYWDNGLLGIAIIGAPCVFDPFNKRNLNVGVAEDSPGTFIGIHAVTHEIGHILGAAHDGDKVNNPPGNPGAQACPWTDGYIMAYPHGTKNKFFFSSCSIDQFKYLLSHPFGACLLDVPAKSVDKCEAVLPGAITSLDQQCQGFYGSEFQFIESKLDIVCASLVCGLKVGNVGLSSVGPALEGSSCGVNKTCSNGECKDKQ